MRPPLPPCWGVEENGKKKIKNWWVGIRAV